MTDWSSYDNIAARYDDVWGSRFVAAAWFMSERVSLTRGATVLDIGTGTGIALQVFSHAFEGSRLTGCDRSTGMIRVARSRIPAARFVTADAVRLPFRDSSFDVATASFVLSHLRNYEAGLMEAVRVLKPGGVFAMASWAAEADAHGDAWRELLARDVSKDLLQAALASVAPWETHFGSPTGVEAALSAAGFVGVEIHAHTLEYTIPLDHFLADRELSASGRFARHSLSAGGWARFVARAREELGRRFGPVFKCSRGILIGRGERGA